MMGVETALAGPATKAGLDVIVRVTPYFWARCKYWIWGKELLIVGQARAGKTTFQKYLWNQIFDDEMDTEETPEISMSDQFDVKVGREGNLKFNVSRAVDIPGQVGATEHANLAFERNPHALVIVLDLTTDLEGEPDRASAAWLRRFCRRLESHWRCVGRKKASRLKSMILVMNKVDKAGQERADFNMKEYNKILQEQLHSARGQIMKEIPIMPCSVVTNLEGEKLVQRVIRELAESLRY
jgi:GTPase SAR1 family protein